MKSNHSEKNSFSWSSFKVGDRVDGLGDGKPIANWEEVRERVEEGSTSGVSTINSNKSPKELMVVHN